MNTTATTQTNATAQCGQCTYWNAQSGDKGECRRHAPQTIGFRVDAQVQFESKFPTTAAKDWCGDYQPKAMSRQ